MRSKASVHQSIGEPRGISASVNPGALAQLLPYTSFVDFSPPRRTRAVH